jgi:uncharacterized FAD-dependent dehydrogenase
MNTSKVIEISIPASEFENDLLLKKRLSSFWTKSADFNYRILRKSIDSRQKTILFNLKVELLGIGDKSEFPLALRSLKKLSPNSEVAFIAGAGPAGLFAALRLIELGIKPILLERGKDVRSRRRDLALLNKEHIVNPESNYCFGEGGAGTYSDGKLYTRSNKRGNVDRVLQTFVEFGADQNILSEAHPHIGTNKLPEIITNIREAILEAGGEVKFNTKLTNIHYSSGKLHSIEINHLDKIACNYLVLATGHSASDIFTMLERIDIKVEFKSFALGVRIEHPQNLIDTFQYHCTTRPDYLPAASYSIVEQVEGRGVYSFCMCPGGIIAPCATEPGQVVTNGWSPSKRNNPWANSGIVVPVMWEDIEEFHSYGPLAGLHFQRSVEAKCWESAGKTQAIPAQRVVDFLAGKKSASLPSCSYIPGLSSERLDLLLPAFISSRLKKAFLSFGKKIPGYLSSEALIVAPESRTSSPVRIPRMQESCQHPDVIGLFPCGEGAGYAGGIVSAAMDGERIADCIHSHITSS